MVYRLAARLAGQRLAGIYAAAVFLANPNLWFLHSAPLSEPIYMTLMLLGADSLLRWRDRGGSGVPWEPASLAAAGALCRYEGWVFAAGLVALAVCEGWRRRASWRQAFRAAGAFAGVTAVPVLLHFGYVYWRLGDSFFQRVARGNPEPIETYGRPLLSVFYHFSEVAQVATLLPFLAGLAGVVFCLADRARLSSRLPYFLLWLPSLLNIAALSWGLMYRVRYSSLLIPAAAVFGGLVLSDAAARRRVLLLACLAAFAFPWISWLFPREWDYHFVNPSGGIMVLPAAALVLWLWGVARREARWQLPLLMVLAMHVPALEGEYHAVAAEASEHRYLEAQRETLIRHLTRHYDGSRILIDIGRLAPLIYDLGLPIKEFVYHDGDPRDWDRAVASPATSVGWICAERGDEVWGLLQVDPHRADGYALALRTEDYVLYQLSPGGRHQHSADGRWP
jgi:hypothetical protein